MSATGWTLTYLGLLVAFTLLASWRVRRFDPFCAQNLFNVPATIYSLGNVINYYWLGLDAASLYDRMRPVAYLEALQLCLPAMVAFNVAYILPKRRTRLVREPEARSESALALNAFACIPFGFAFLLTGVVSFGWGRVFLMPYGSSDLSAAPTAVLFHVGTLLVDVPLVLLGSLLFRQRRWRSPTGLGVSLLVLAYVAFCLFYGKRAMILMNLLGLLVVRHLHYKRLAWGGAVMMGISMLALFVVVEFGRAAPTRTPGDIVETTVQNAPAPSPEEWRSWVGAVLGQGALVGSLTIITELYPHVYPYRLGGTYLEAIVRTLPRALWSDRLPLGYSQLIGDNWAFFYLAEAYMNFGPIGLIIVPALMGLLLRLFDDWKERNGATLLAPTTFAILAGDLAYLPRLDLGGLSKDFVYRPILLWLLLRAAPTRVGRPTRRTWGIVPRLGHAGDGGPVSAADLPQSERT